MEYILSPSLLAADFGHLDEELKKVAKAGARYIHLDIMDGCFVPSISFGIPVIASLRQYTSLTFDVHLMIREADRYLKDFARAGADIITVHAEAVQHLDRTLGAIRDLGCRSGLALNPATPLSALEWVLPQCDMVLLMSVNPGFGGQSFIPYTLEKIARLRHMIEEKGLKTDIEVDGGIHLGNVEEVLKAGANVIVAGTAVFGQDTEASAAAFADILERQAGGK